MNVYVGRWDCEFCGNKGNLGPHQHCSQCGAARPKTVQFYLPSDEQALQDQQELAEAEAGPDWICSNCTAHNKMAYANCVGCGSAYRKEDGDGFLQQKEYDENNVPRSADAPVTPAREIEQPKGLSPGAKRKGCFGVVIAGIIAWLATFSSTVEVTVSGYEWNRTLQIEKYVSVQESDWQVPSEGKLIRSYRAEHHKKKISKGTERKTRTVKVQTGTEQYVCGKDDLGNGYFRDRMCTRPVYTEKEEEYEEEIFEEEPVYQTKYDYTIMRWKPDEPLKTSGTDHNPKWGNKEGLAEGKLFRIIGREEEYKIIVKDSKGENHKETLELSRWERTNMGDKLKAKKSRFFGYYKGLAD